MWKFGKGAICGWQLMRISVVDVIGRDNVFITREVKLVTKFGTTDPRSVITSFKLPPSAIRTKALHLVFVLGSTLTIIMLLGGIQLARSWHCGCVFAQAHGVNVYYCLYKEN